ncbi:DUF475 domain-containing protein [Herminiimonas sp. CN]|uniref:DUF475 domain-containing protein n=1 Tax=Herminiimonas sp. CN TaxID=1349818 RepID=UPI0004739001|nr:DUF475 domain-containing protein [Herminiimonas sp. CN]
MKSQFSYFTGSFLFCLVAVVLAYFIGGPKASVTVVFLTVLETSLSFDNAVVNAGILNGWNAVWRRRFLVWGILVAVFGMRLVFPLVIVGVAGHVGPITALDMAINAPVEYSRILSSAHHQIAAFGGTFLMMVFFSFFVATHKTEHWLSLIEKPMTRLGKMEAIEAALTLLVLLAAASMLDADRRGEFIEAGIWGIVTYVFAKGAAALMGGADEGAAQHVVKQGVGGFLYLELIDASFSFDGVIGAFALTNNLFIIALGLGAGAMFVRSFTLLLVENGTLTRFRYLEHGAFWAIGALAVLMLVGVTAHISEAVTGTLGALLIVASLASSILANRKSVELK